LRCSCSQYTNPRQLWNGLEVAVRDRISFSSIEFEDGLPGSDPLYTGIG